MPEFEIPFRLMKFIDNLTNWYVRTNRKRLKGEGTTLADSRQALDTLFSVLVSCANLLMKIKIIVFWSRLQIVQI
jgi:isoleucyl-tRNA synthetase